PRSRTVRCGTPCRRPGPPARPADGRCTSRTAWARASARLLGGIVVEHGRVFQLVVDVGRDRRLEPAPTLVDGAYPSLDEREPQRGVEPLRADVLIGGDHHEPGA